MFGVYADKHIAFGNPRTTGMSFIKKLINFFSLLANSNCIYSFIVFKKRMPSNSDDIPNFNPKIEIKLLSST